LKEKKKKKKKKDINMSPCGHVVSSNVLAIANHENERKTKKNGQIKATGVASHYMGSVKNVSERCPCQSLDIKSIERLPPRSGTKRHSETLLNEIQEKAKPRDSVINSIPIATVVLFKLPRAP